MVESIHTRVARATAAISAVVGVAASAALLAPYIVRRGFCGAGGGCDRVAHSTYSMLFGVPRPAIGVVAFLALLTVVLMRGSFARRLGALLALPFIVEGLHLLYIQAFILHAWCPFCVAIDLSSIVAGVAMLAEWWSVERDRDRQWLWPRRLIGAGLVAVVAPLGIALARPPVVTSQPIAAVPKRDGKLVLREFIDLECPYCRMTHVALKKALVARPDVVIERRHVPLPMHEHAEVAATAACCAGEQGAEDKFVDAVMTTEAPPNEVNCTKIAISLGLDVTKFIECCQSERPKKRIDDDKALATTTKVAGLPTIDLEGERHVGALSEADAVTFLARHP
jgi:protein-disulfide isomerase/uncharacterized membrane protein